MSDLPGLEPIETVIKRIEEAMVKAVTDVPCGVAHVTIGDLRRLITELERRIEQ